MPDLACTLCGGLGWVETRAAGCPACNPPREKPKRRKPQRRLPAKSEKKKAIEAVLNPFRAEWCQRVKFCMVCHIRKARHVHEIVAGSGRHLSVEDPLCWMACCSKRCHDKVQGIPFEEQLEYVMESHRRSVNRCGIRNAV